MTKDKPRILLAMPYDRDPMGQAHQSAMMTMTNPNHEIVPMNVSNTVVHLARNTMIDFVRSDKSFDGLVMVDSDQVWGPRVVERLYRWGVPCVAPVIAQGNGPALPVAYQHVGVDDKGRHAYNPRLYEISAYMSMFNADKFAGPSSILPADPDHPPLMEDLPPATREGLSSPLLEVDAVGTGMVYFEGEMLRSLEEPPEGWFHWNGGGEDFAFCRLLKASGFPIFVDRGCFVGHMRQYARGPMDIWAHVLQLEKERRSEEEKTANLPPASELAAKLHELGERNETPKERTPKPWDSVQLPQPTPALHGALC